MNILITAVGSLPEVNFIQAIRSIFPDIHIIGTDIHEAKKSIGSDFVDVFYQVPHGSDPTYIDIIKNICQKESINIIKSSPENEVNTLINAQESLGITILHSGKETSQIITDKYSVSLFLKKLSYPSLQTHLLSQIDETFLPCILKHRNGRGGNVSICMDVDDLMYYKKKKLPNEEYIAQQYIKGSIEYSVDCIVDTHKHMICLPRRRTSTNGSTATITTVEINENIINTIYNFLDDLPNAYGGLNIQGFLVENNFFITDVNPRFGGASSIALKNVQEFQIFLRNMLLGKEEKNTDLHRAKLTTYEGLTMMRSFHESFVYLSKE